MHADEGDGVRAQQGVWNRDTANAGDVQHAAAHHHAPPRGASLLLHLFFLA